MPREKNAQDWILTWSPENDCDELPREIKDMVDCGAVRRYYAIAEKHGDNGEKWHVHVGFSTNRTFNSDYKWWKQYFDSVGFKEPALDIKYHNSIFGLVGGYCSKTENTKQLGCRGFTTEQLEYGKTLYEKRQRRQRIRKFVDEHVVIGRNKIEVAIGAMQGETDCNTDEAIKLLADDGFAFAESKKGLEYIYAANYKDKMSIERE